MSIYAAIDDERSLLKVGYTSTSWKTRNRTPRLRLLRIVPGTLEDERDLIGILGVPALPREWFADTVDNRQKVDEWMSARPEVPDEPEYLLVCLCSPHPIRPEACTCEVAA